MKKNNSALFSVLRVLKPLCLLSLLYICHLQCPKWPSRLWAVSFLSALICYCAVIFHTQLRSFLLLHSLPSSLHITSPSLLLLWFGNTAEYFFKAYLPYLCEIKSPPTVSHIVILSVKNIIYNK